jgi:hypothetical protein
MGWVVMSERDLNRVEVIAQVADGRLSVNNGANLLDLSRRQVFGLLQRYRQDGASALRHLRGASLRTTAFMTPGASTPCR